MLDRRGRRLGVVPSGSLGMGEPVESSRAVQHGLEEVTAMFVVCPAMLTHKYDRPTL